MESALKTIFEHNMFKKGETIAVAVSGGIDSICLLHFLYSQSKKFGIKIVAVNVDHKIRETSAKDTKFVVEFCKKIDVPCYKFKIDVPTLSKEKKLGIEETARIARYNIFDSVLQNGIADKIAIAHHQSDQVETILLNIFRGSGLKGASGMEAVQGKYVRPFLNTTKTEILNYAKEHNLEYVTDESNFDNEYSRNFLRNEIIPKLKTKWKNVETNIINFANICKQDDEYINSTLNFDDIEFNAQTARIPLYKFVNSISVQNRILRYCFAKLGLSKDVERRHLNILRNLVESSKSGSKINLPNKLRASIEYDELVLSVPKEKAVFIPKDFKTGKTNFENVSITVKKSEKFDPYAKNCHTIDADKLPQDAKWRARQNGDVFTKFGGGEKKLKDYLIDIKVPNSIRDQIPVLASGKEIYCVLGYEISDKVKVTENTKIAYVIKYEKK